MLTAKPPKDLRAGWQRWVIGCIVAVVLGVAGYLAIRSPAVGSLRDLPVEVRSQTDAVMRAYALRNWVEPYWENEFSVQCATMKNVEAKHRVEFYVFIALNCNLDTSRCTIFEDQLGADADAFFERIKELRATKGPFDAETSKRIAMWISP